MRIALVSPYSWTYPGGVTRHIEALADRFLAEGHDVRVLAPFDPPDARSARLHRGAAPQPRELPAHVVPLGRTVGIASNGAVSNLSVFPSGVQRLRRELEAGRFDVVNVHEPVAPAISWDALEFSGAALVGTFHTYGTNAASHGAARAMGAARRMNALHGRIAVSDAAAWTARRFFGGRYDIVPNGVHVPELVPVHPAGERGRLRIAFVGQAVERKGLPVLLRAFEALREHVDAELVIVGAVTDEVLPLLLEGQDRITVLGRVDDAEKTRVLREADVLCAPSLGGESFGMVLTEAFAQGTPVVASDIAGYRDVVRDGVDGLLVPRADPQALAGVLRDLALAPARRAALSRCAAERAHRYAWPRVADEVLAVYRRSIAARERAVARPAGAGARAARRLALVPADGGPLVPPQRLATLEPAPPGGHRRARVRRVARRAGLATAAAAGAALTLLALQRIGVDRVGESLLRSSPSWVIAALLVMCASMVVRAVSWTAILRAALPSSGLRFTDALQGTAIGVLMSATLPARLGEPARALIVARRAGRPRETTPVVVGTLVSQTLLNVLALVLLGVVAFSTVHVFDDHHGALAAVAIAPAALLAVVVLGPAVLRATGASARLRAITGPVQRAAAQVRDGLRVFRDPRRAGVAVGAQLTAWALQAVSCWLLLVAIGLDERAGIGAAAAVLLAVNVTAVLPATPSNLGVFQAACVAVLTGAYGVSAADALGYGIVLQAVEIATAVIMGVPALLKEGLSWRDVRLRALHSTPVRLPPLPAPAASEAQLAEA
jgi:phosphatidylinositol alpha-mannosyltransferase